MSQVRANAHHLHVVVWVAVASRWCPQTLSEFTCCSYALSVGPCPLCTNYRWFRRPLRVHRLRLIHLIRRCTAAARFPSLSYGCPWSSVHTGCSWGVPWSERKCDRCSIGAVGDEYLNVFLCLLELSAYPAFSPCTVWEGTWRDSRMQCSFGSLCFAL